MVGGVSGSGSARARNVTEADGASGRVAPPLDLPPRRGSANGSNGSAAAPASGWSRGAGRSAGTVSAGTVSGGRCVGGHWAAAAGGVGSAGAVIGPAGQEPGPEWRNRAARQPSRAPPVQLRRLP